MPRLAGQGHAVRAAGRRRETPDAREWAGVEVVQADALDPDSLTAAFEGVDLVYYLVHSMASGSGPSRARPACVVGRPAGGRGGGGGAHRSTSGGCSRGERPRHTSPRAASPFRRTHLPLRERAQTPAPVRGLGCIVMAALQKRRPFRRPVRSAAPKSPFRYAGKPAPASTMPAATTAIVRRQRTSTRQGPALPVRAQASPQTHLRGTHGGNRGTGDGDRGALVEPVLALEGRSFAEQGIERRDQPPGRPRVRPRPGSAAGEDEGG